MKSQVDNRDTGSRKIEREKRVEASTATGRREFSGAGGKRGAGMQPGAAKQKATRGGDQGTRSRVSKG